MAPLERLCVLAHYWRTARQSESIRLIKLVESIRLIKLVEGFLKTYRRSELEWHIVQRRREKEREREKKNKRESRTPQRIGRSIVVPTDHMTISRVQWPRHVWTQSDGCSRVSGGRGLTTRTWLKMEPSLIEPMFRCCLCVY